jgi:hypothetical protein
LVPEMIRPMQMTRPTNIPMSSDPTMPHPSYPQLLIGYCG